MEHETDYTISGVMRRLNISRQSVYDLTKSGALKSYKVKTATRITAESVEALRNGQSAVCS